MYHYISYYISSQFRGGQLTWDWCFAISKHFAPCPLMLPVNTKSRVFVMAVGVVSFLPTFLTRCIVIYSCVNFLSMVVTLKECTTIDHCSCSTDEGKISLWELAGTGTPR